MPEFRRILRSTLFQAIFFTLPLTAVIIVLRIPLVRLAYGTNIFDWQSTVETGYVLSAFGIGIVFQTLMSILTRSFFALHDTKTPVYISMIGLFLLVVGDASLVLGFGIPVWALAISFTFSTFIETILLLYLLNKRISGFITPNMVVRVGKMIVASGASSFVMYFFLKLFDRSVWVKQLSFLGKVDIASNINFELFVLDTRYTINLLALTLFVMASGGLTYLLVLFLLQSKDLSNFFGILNRLSLKNKNIFVPQKEQEPMAPTASDNSPS